VRESIAAEPVTVIYDGEMENGWERYGWAKVLDQADRSHARPGRPACITCSRERLYVRWRRESGARRRSGWPILASAAQTV